MCKRLLLFTSLICMALYASGQAPVRRLPSSINHPSLNLYAPFISADGNALVFISDNGQDGAYVVSYTSRENDWNPPVDLPKHVHTRLNYMRGFGLSADGKRLYLTSAKSPVIGGYDIFISDLKGNTWSAPENMMLPINSRSNEGSPSVTPDGNTIYFMRCEKMDQIKADGCRIFKSSKKPNGQWEEPVELPANINTGNSQTPRIMADGETLIFSSDKMGGKGGMDLFVTRLKNGNWTVPVPMDFANTEKDDQFVSVTALGRYLLKEGKGTRNNNELTEYLIPAALRPRGLMKVEGKVSGPDGKNVPSYITATDLTSRNRIYSGRPGVEGTFAFYLPEGSKYEVSVDPEQSDFTYAAKVYDLTTDRIPQKEKMNVILRKPQAGDEFPLELVLFRENTSDLEPASLEELKRFSRMAKANGGMNFEIQVFMQGLMQDSIQGNPDLTEVITDTILVVTDTLRLVDGSQATVRTRYHNDRTKQQADQILQYLQSQGVKPEQLTIQNRAVESPDGQKKLEIKAVVR